ncbi:Ig-like domain-containing protein [Planctomycetota bacterium]
MKIRLLILSSLILIAVFTGVSVLRSRGETENTPAAAMVTERPGRPAVHILHNRSGTGPAPHGYTIGIDNAVQKRERISEESELQTGKPDAEDERLKAGKIQREGKRVRREEFRNAPVLEEKISPQDEDGSYTRVRIIKTDMKYPLVRIEDEIRKIDDKETIVKHTAMVADHVIVKVKKGTDQETLAKICEEQGMNIRRKLSIPGVFLIQVPKVTVDAVSDTSSILNKQLKHITYAEPDYLVYAAAEPDDPDFSKLWGMHNTGQTGGYADADIDAPEAWHLETGSSSIVVAVIDTGIDYNHPDLIANMWVNTAEQNGDTGVDDDNNGFVDDIHGWDFCNNDKDPMDDHFHGTHCAGTIGAVGDNTTGVAGVCWNVSIMALKFLSGGGSGSSSDAAEAVYYATKMGAVLSSNSWGGGGFTQTLKDAIDDAGSKGVLFIAAAGNNSTDIDGSDYYPVGYDCDNIIGVAALDHQDAMASFSNWGLTKVDLGAPGVSIYSTFPINETDAMKNYGFSTYYESISGTSMATPHVAGACALLKSRMPSFTGSEIKAQLMETVDQIEALDGKCVSGGRLNIGEAVYISEDPVPLYGGAQIDDEAGGNDDGLINPGETVDLLVTMRNVGLSSLSGVQALLSTADPYVTVTDNSALFGDIPARGSVPASDSYTIEIGVDCPTPHTVEFNLSIADSGTGSWTDSFSLMVYTSYQISGTVTRDGAPLENAVIEYRGPLLGTFLTGPDGTYMFGVIEGTYKLTAKKDDYLPSADVEITVPESQADVDFAFTTATVSGTVTNGETEDPMSGASVEYFGGFSGSVLTAGDGTYSITKVYGRDSYLYLTAKADGFFDSARIRVDLPPDAAGIDFALGYSDIEVSPASFSVTAELGQAPERTLTISNNGTQELSWSISHGTLGEVKKTLSLGANYTGVAFDGAVLWLSQGYYGTRIYKINPENGQVLGNIDVGFKCSAIDWDGENLWGLDYTALKVKAIDPATGSTVASFDAPRDNNGNSPSGVMVSDKYLWVVASSQAHKLNPETGEVLGSVNLSTSTNVQGAAFYNGGIWTRAYTSDYDWETGEWTRYYGMCKCDPITGYRIMFADIPGDYTDGWGSGFSRSSGSGIWVLNSIERKLRLIETAEVEWLSEDPDAGTTEGKSSTEVTVTFDTVPAGVGTHTANIIISSNDPDEPEVTVPVEFIVTDDGENSPPVITASSPATPFSMDEGTSQDFTLTASDPDGDVLKYIWEFDDNPTDAESIPSYTYAPDFTESGAHTIKVTADDRLGGTVSHTWNVTVNHVNIAPETEDLFASTPKGSTDPATFTMKGSDFDEDPLVYIIVDSPSHGTLSSVSGDQVTYTPDGAHIGLDTFTYKVNDGITDSNISTATVYCGLQLKITDLGTLGGSESRAFAINRHGDITGDSRFNTGSNTRIFLYDYSESTLTDLGLDNHSYCTGYGINRHGDIGGYTSPSAFLYSEGTFTDLGIPGAPDYNVAAVMDINDKGIMAGYSYYAIPFFVLGYMAWIHDGENYIDLGNFGSPYISASAINNFKEVVGSGNVTGEGYRAFIYDPNNGLRNLNNVAPVGEDWILMYATDIIDDGTIVGKGTFQEETNHGFVFKGDTITDLGTLGGSGSVTSVNNNHVAIGQEYITSSRKYRPFIYFPDHGRIHIDHILPEAETWEFEYISDLNDACQIVGYGKNPSGEEHACLLEPYNLNKLPVAVDDTAETDEDTPVTVDVLANDTDGDGDPLTIIRAGMASNGTVVINGDDVTYTPNQDFNGTDEFFYTISDGKGGTDTAAVTVTVNPINDAPVAVDDSAETDEDTPVDIDVLANDNDVDGDSLDVTGVSVPANGTAVINGDNTVTYTPDPDFNGEDSFTYTISDGNGGTDSATVTITVNPVNDPPVAVDDSVETDEDTPVDINVLANDSDPDGDPLTVESCTTPSNGATVISGNNTVTYTPDLNFNGEDSFTYTISDGNGGTDSATVTITVNPVNDPPVAEDQAVATAKNTPLDIELEASDPDGDTLTYTVQDYPLNGTLTSDDGDDTVTYTPDTDYTGSDSLTFLVNDGTVDSNTATVSITVTDDTIIIVSVSTEKDYSLAPSVSGCLYYIDRSYTVQGISTGLDGGVLVRTANDDKRTAEPSHLMLYATEEVTVSVCYDPRAAVLPDWLDNGTWTLSGEFIDVPSLPGSPLDVYIKTFPAGNIELGGNLAPTADGSVSSYIVIIKPTDGDAQYIEGPVAADTWVHDGDTDGDGLYDEFENYIELDPEDIDTDDDTLVDEEEEGMWDDQEDYYDKDDDKKKKDKSDDGGGGCMPAEDTTPAPLLILTILCMCLIVTAKARSCELKGKRV